MLTVKSAMVDFSNIIQMPYLMRGNMWHTFANLIERTLQTSLSKASMSFLKDCNRFGPKMTLDQLATKFSD